MALDATPPEPQTFVGQVTGGIVWAVVTLSVLIGAACRLMGWPSKEKPETSPSRIEALELTDTSGIKQQLQRLYEKVDEGGSESRRQMDDLIRRIDHLERESEKRWAIEDDRQRRG